MLPTDAKRDLMDLLQLLSRRRWMIFVSVATCATLALLHGILATPVYEAEASILLKFGREHTYQPEVGEGTPAVTLNVQEIIGSEMEILRSPQLARDVIGRVGLNRLYGGIDNPPDPYTISWLRVHARDALSFMHPRPVADGENDVLERAAGKFAEDFVVETAGRSSVLNLGFFHDDPQVAAETVNAAVESFKELRLKLLSQPPAAFLEDKVAEFRERVSETEAKLETFRQENGLYDLARQRELALEQRTTLEQDYAQSSSAVEEMQQRLAVLVDQSSRITATMPLSQQRQRDPVVSDAKSRLLGLKLKEAELLAKYLPGSKLVEDVRTEIQLVETFLKEAENEVSTTVTTGTNQVHQELALDIARLRGELRAETAKVAAQKTQLERLNERLALIDRGEKQLNEWRRDVENATFNYNTYQAKLTEARISEDLNNRKLANVSSVEMAVAPLSPASPQRAKNLALSIVFGLGLGVCLVAVSQYIRPRITGADFAERTLGLPVLATVGRARA